MEETKNTIRKQMLEKRKQLTEEEIKIKSSKIIEKIDTLEHYKKANWVFTYINMGTEVETIPLIEKAWNEGKRVAVPVAVRGSRELFFVEIKNFENMKRSKIGVMEPLAQIDQEQHPEDGTFFVVPGSVFDTAGNRFGYGAGYYDTYAQRFPNLKKNAVAYELQVLDEILPVEAHDKKMDFIITENKILKFS